jgi:hypothetical protein
MENIFQKNPYQTYLIFLWRLVIVLIKVSTEDYILFHLIIFFFQSISLHPGLFCGLSSLLPFYSLGAAWGLGELARGRDELCLSVSSGACSLLFCRNGGMSCKSDCWRQITSILWLNGKDGEIPWFWYLNGEQRATAVYCLFPLCHPSVESKALDQTHALV